MTVGPDYLYETPVMIGSVRIGPDLANIALRRPDEVWHLTHLYDPKLQVPGSIMPRYPFLFEKRRRGLHANRDALPISGEYDIIPTREARALVTYLVSLRAELPLFSAPAPPLPGAAAAAAATNQPPGGVTNAAPTGESTSTAAPTNQAGQK
jgi:cytochrome c oxidase cbb3-type subunit 2